MNNRYRLSIVLVALALTCQSCGLLISSNHDVEAYKPVFADASTGNLEAVKAAVKNDKGVLKATEWDGATLLHLAVQQNQKAMADLEDRIEGSRQDIADQVAEVRTELRERLPDND